VQDSDFDAIAALTNVFIRTTAIHFAYEDVSAAELLAAFREHEAVYPFLVAESGGAFAGFAKAGPWRTRAAYRWTVETGVYVAPERHGQGIGGMLYRRLLEVLKVQGFRTVVGGITLPNAASVALHERSGFRASGVVQHAGFKFGKWHDVGFWQLDLRPGDPAAPTLLTPLQAWERSHQRPL
jgi:phosphinothricin acetyltransferase